MELTKTVEKRKMREQYLDQMDLERERGITIKMQPVRMLWHPQSEISKIKSKKEDLRFDFYILNLIDTPGHIDFSYEVSRSLKAVEAAVLLVDATQGVQAQTISNLEMAKEQNLSIIPVVNKIDSPNARLLEVKAEIVEILKCNEDDILEISAKTGEGVESLLKEIIRRVPLPIDSEKDTLRALIFDFEYSTHRGVILYVRIFGGSIKKGDRVFLFQSKREFQVNEVGVFTPLSQSVDILKNGEIGYVITNIKEANIAKVGDTLLLKDGGLEPLKGYKEPAPVVWVGIFPESQDEFDNLKQALERLKLRDSALSFDEERSGVLGRGFRCGFLGMLHLEIIIERLKREFSLDLVIASPTVVYTVETLKEGVKKIYSSSLFPEHFEIKRILEPCVRVEVITPVDKLSLVLQVLRKHEAIVKDTKDFGEGRLLLVSEMALREIVDNFFEELKSASEGYASFNYEIVGEKEADLVRLDMLLNSERVPAFSRVIKRIDMQRQAQNMARQLKLLLPRALFTIKIQVRGMGRILASQSLSALKKDVTGHLYGGDRTRKMKLWQKQKRGKKKLKQFGEVNIPHDVFIKMMRGEMDQ